MRISVEVPIRLTIMAVILALAALADATSDHRSSLSSEQFYEQGLRLLTQKQYKAAAEILTESLKFQSRPDVLAARGEAYYHLKLYDEALNDVSKSLQLNPKNHYSYMLRAAIHDRMKKTHDAIDDLSRAISLNPQNATSFRMRGAGYLTLGENDKALKDLNRAILLGEQSSAVYQNRALVYEALGRYEEAVHDLTASLQMDPLHQNVLLHRAWAYGCLRSFDKGLQDLARILREDPQNLQARLLRAWLYIETKEFKRALEDLNHSLLHGSKSPWVFLNLASVYYQMGDMENAYSANQKAIDLNEEQITIDALFQKGLFLLAQGKVDDAQKAYDSGQSFAKHQSNLDALEDGIEDLRQAIEAKEVTAVIAHDIFKALIETKTRIVGSKTMHVNHNRCQSPRARI